MQDSPGEILQALIASHRIQEGHPQLPPDSGLEAAASYATIIIIIKSAQDVKLQKVCAAATHIVTTTMMTKARENENYHKSFAAMSS